LFSAVKCPGVGFLGIKRNMTLPTADFTELAKGSRSYKEQRVLHVILNRSQF
jgi:hypothetical protein